MKKYRRIGVKTLKISIIIAFLFIFVHIVAFTIAYMTPKLDIRNANSVFLYDKEGNLFFQGNGYNEWISLNKMSHYIKDATIATEDKNFYYHDGFDYLRIVKSFYQNITSGRIVGGASTITQQYAKNLYLTFDQNLKRKIEEAWLAFEIEVHYSKDEILEGYLNTINYGNGVYGIENAAKYYFGKSAADLDLAEASMLAGIPKSPYYFSPINYEKTAKKRQNIILSAMVRNKYITAKDKEDALNEKLTYVGKKEKYNLATLMYFQDAVMDELKDLGYAPQSITKNAGLKIYTTLDIDAQTIMENSINSNLKNNSDIQVSSVMADPSTGNILALAGGRDYEKSQFNRVTQSKRQVGSTIKPFLYYSALENGLTATSTFLSEPTVFTVSDNKTYAPKNFNNIYPGKPITMAAAIAYSDNIYAVKTHLFLGEETLLETLHRVGIKQDMQPHPSLPLGTEELNILDYLTGYNTLANGGDKIELHLINKIEDKNGNIIYEHHINKENVLNKSITFIVNDLLTGTYDSNLIDYNYPTCINIAAKLTKKYAIKSGSTDYDTWTIGYNPNILLGVWNGYDKNTKLGTNESKYSKNIWADTIEGYLKNKTTTWYTMPSNVVGVLVNPITGEAIGSSSPKTEKRKILYYINGTQPLYKK